MSMNGPRIPEFIEKRKRPIGYTFAGGRAYAVGNYEIPCGGCDTIKILDVTVGIIAGAAERGLHVLAEGVMLGDDIKRTFQLSKKYPTHIILLSTPLEECLKNVAKRRAERGLLEPMNPHRTTRKFHSMSSACRRLKDAGVTVEKHSYESAMERIGELLGFTTSRE
jgi:hypothetical protein